MYPESSTGRESQPRLLLVLGSAVTRYRYAEPCELGEAGESQALFDYMCLISQFGEEDDEIDISVKTILKLSTLCRVSCFILFNEKPWKGDDAPGCTWMAEVLL